MERSSLRARICSPSCFGIFTLRMTCLCWWICAPASVLAADDSCRKISPAVPLSLGNGTSEGLWCDVECDAPAESGNISAGVTTNHSIRGKHAKSEPLHPSVPSHLYPYLRCSSDSGTNKASGGQVEVNLHPNSTSKYRMIVFMNFAALKLTADPFHSAPEVLKVMQFENVGRLDLSSFDLVARNLSLEIRHSSVIFSRSSWRVFIASLTMFNVSADTLPLIAMGLYLKKVSIAEGTFNFTSCSDGVGNEDYYRFREHISDISIRDSRIETMLGCSIDLPLERRRIAYFETLLLTRVKIGQVQAGCLSNVRAHTVIFNMCEINHLQGDAFMGLRYSSTLRLKETVVGRVGLHVLPVTDAHRYSSIELLRNHFLEVPSWTSFSIPPRKRFLSSKNKAHTSQCSCETLRAWQLSPTAMPIKQVICDPARTEKEDPRSAEDVLCNEINCFEPSSTKHCSMQVLNSADNSTQLSCIFNRSEIGYENATWLSSALALAAGCKKIKGIRLENVGSFPFFNITGWRSSSLPRTNGRLLYYSDNKTIWPQKLDFLEVRGIAEAVFATASSQFTECCKRISIEDVSKISFMQGSDERAGQNKSLESSNSFASILRWAGRRSKRGVRLEFLNNDPNNQGLKMRASCCQNFSIERDYELTEVALLTLIEDCMGHCNTEDVACIEQRFPSVQKIERTSYNNSFDTSHALSWVCNFLGSKRGRSPIMGKSTFVLGQDHPLKEVIFQSDPGTLILQNGALSNIAASKITLQGISDLHLEDNALQTPASSLSHVTICILNSTITKFLSFSSFEKELVDKRLMSDGHHEPVKRSLVLRHVDVKAPLPTFHLLRDLENLTVNFSSIHSLVAWTQPAEVPANVHGDKYETSSHTFGHLRILNSDVKVIEMNAVHLDHAEAFTIVNSSIGLLMKNAIRIGDLQMLRLENNSFSRVDSRALRVDVSGNVILSNSNILHPSRVMPFEIRVGKKTNLERVDKLKLGNGSCSCASLIPDPEGGSEPESRNLMFTDGYLRIEFECSSTNGTMIPALEYRSTNCAEVRQMNAYIIITPILSLVLILMVIAGVKWIHHKQSTDRRWSGHVEILEIHPQNPSSASTVAAPVMLPEPSRTEYPVDDGEYIELPPPKATSEPSQGPIPIEETDHTQQAGGRSESIFGEIPCRLGNNLDDRPYAEIVENVYSEPFEGKEGASASRK